MKLLLTFFLLLLFSTTTNAQPLCQVKHITVNDGLSQGVATTILQDQKGFIWISTWNGLDKYDGYNFRNYKAYPGDSCMLSNNRITSIAESRYGNIWCQTYDGHCFLFNVATEEFIDVLRDFETDTQMSFIIMQTHVLPKGVTWLVCDQGYTLRIQEARNKDERKPVIEMFGNASQRLKGKTIYSIFQDSEGDEWILTDNGVSIIGSKQIQSDFPFHFIKEVNQRIFFISNSGKLAEYNADNGKIKFITIPESFQQVNSVELIDNNNIALCTDNGVILFDPSTGCFETLHIQSKEHASRNATSVFRDSHKNYWIFSDEQGIIRINKKLGETQYFSTPISERIKYPRSNRHLVFEDKTGMVWLIPEKGNFSYYDREEKKLKTFYSEVEGLKIAYMPNVRYFYTDNQKNLWLISARGIEKLSFFNPAYQQNPIDDGMEQRTLFIDRKNQLWVTSKTGMIRIYSPDGTLAGYLSKDGAITSSESRFYSSVYSILEDTAQRIWLGTKDEGLFLLNEITDKKYTVKQFKHDKEQKYSLSNNSIYALEQDSKGRIWVGTFGGGINLIDKAESNDIQFLNYSNRLKNFPSIQNHRVRCIKEVSNGVILAGTTQGLLSFSSDFDQPEEIVLYNNIRKPNIASSLGGNDVMHIYTNNNDDIYITTFTGGVSKVLSGNLLQNGIEFKSFTRRNGLASDLTLSSIEDADKNLWIIQENALTKFNPATESFENYGHNFLQQRFIFTEAAPVINGDGQLIFGTNKGIISIDPHEMQKDTYVPPIALTGLRIQGSASPRGIGEMKELTLSPSQRNITLQYSALDYVAPSEIKYAHRMEGFEVEWNEVDQNRSASYINLPPGTYNFQVRSTNSDGVWVDNVKTLTLHVKPTFWETIWAWIFYITLFLMLTGAVVYILFYIYRLRHRVDMEQQLADIKLRFFTDISHELRTPLTLIASPVTEILEREPVSDSVRSHLSLVHKNTERMLRLVNEILDFRKIENKKMKLLIEEAELIGFTRKIMDSFRLIAVEKQIDFTLDTTAGQLPMWIDSDKVEKILFNLISNAFKYTPNGKRITIGLAIEENSVLISVTDQGHGIELSKQKSLFQRFETVARHNMMHSSSGIGLSLTKELVELHHGRIELRSEPGKGSCFCVELPAGKQVYEKDPRAEFILSDSYNPAVENSLLADNVNLTPLQNEIPATRDEEKLTILIVEDNDELRLFLHNILCNSYNVVQAINGKKGLEATRNSIPDIIISDVMMPVMDGLDMVKAIKEDRNICHIPIILLSAKSSLDDRIAGLESGIDDYITKPFSATYLKTRINSLLQQRKQLQAVYLERISANGEQKKNIIVSPSQPQITPQDELFIQQTMAFMEEQMDNPDLTVDDFAEKLLVSRTIFYRKLKAILGISPVDFIRDMRIKRAVQLIETDQFNISEVAYMTGFNDPKYFSKCFKKQMGVSPSEHKAPLKV